MTMAGTTIMVAMAKRIVAAKYPGASSENEQLVNLITTLGAGIQLALRHPEYAQRLMELVETEGQGAVALGETADLWVRMFPLVGDMGSSHPEEGEPP